MSIPVIHVTNIIFILLNLHCPDPECLEKFEDITEWSDHVINFHNINTGFQTEKQAFEGKMLEKGFVFVLT